MLSNIEPIPLEDSTPPQILHRKVLVFVCLVVFFDAMGVGLILPIMPDLISQLSNISNGRAAEISGYLLFTYAVMQFIFAPIIGGLSDHFGRRPVLLFSLLGFGINYFLMASSETLTLLFIARLISGVFGATYSAASAAIVDISEKETRARFFGTAGAAIGLGFILGPTLGGLLGEINTRLPFILAGVMSLFTLAFGWFMFPETLKSTSKRRFEWRRANPLGCLLSVTKYPAVAALLIAVLFIQLSKQSYMSIWPFYTIEVARWTPFDIGLSTAMYGFLMILVQGALIGPVVKIIGEQTTLWIGLLMGALGFLVLALAAGPQAIYVGIMVSGFGEFSLPTTQSLMTRQVPENAQGELQGAIASTYSVSAILGPVGMAYIFAKYTTGANVHFPGAPFILAVIFIMCTMLALLSYRRLARTE